MRKTRKPENQKDYYCHSLIKSGKKKKRLFKFLKHRNLSWKRAVQNIIIRNANLYQVSHIRQPQGPTNTPPFIPQTLRQVLTHPQCMKVRAQSHQLESSTAQGPP